MDGWMDGASSIKRDVGDMGGEGRSGTVLHNVTSLMTADKEHPAPSKL